MSLARNWTPSPAKRTGSPPPPLLPPPPPSDAADRSVDPVPAFADDEKNKQTNKTTSFIAGYAPRVQNENRRFNRFVFKWKNVKIGALF